MATLSSGQSLYPGQSLQSNNQLHTLIMQTDGNVVLYDRYSQPLWATHTGGLITPREFIMQTDGNLVLYDISGSPKWASNTWNNPGAFFKVQDDGNLVVYQHDAQTETADNALWAAGSNDMIGSADSVEIGSTQLNDELKSTLSEILPDLAQLLQQYQISQTLEIVLEGAFLNESDRALCSCCLVNGGMRCGSVYRPSSLNENTLGLTHEQAQQLSRDVESKLTTTLSHLSSPIQQAGENFEVRLFIDPAIADSGQPTVCQWVNNTSQSKILQCANP